jgi:hypothetical protein
MHDAARVMPTVIFIYVSDNCGKDFQNQDGLAWHRQLERSVIAKH